MLLVFFFLPASPRNPHLSRAGTLPNSNWRQNHSCSLQRSIPSAQSLRHVIEFRTRALSEIFERVSAPGRTKSYAPDQGAWPSLRFGSPTFPIDPLVRRDGRGVVAHPLVETASQRPAVRDDRSIVAECALLAYTHTMQRHVPSKTQQKI